MSDFDLISKEIEGRLAMSREDADILQKISALCETWLEIGTLYGGSSILAALANPKIKIISLDPFVYEQANYETAIKNLKHFGVDKRVAILKEYSQEYVWDAPVDGVFVDGSHDFEDVVRDAGYAKKVARKYILFHDMDDPEVGRAVYDTMDGWKEIESSKRIAVYECI